MRTTMARKRTTPAAGKWPALLVRIREHYRLTQTEAAERIGVALRTWQNWEYGRRNPNSAAAKSILEKFPMK